MDSLEISFSHFFSVAELKALKVTGVARTIQSRYQSSVVEDRTVANYFQKFCWNVFKCHKLIEHFFSW